MSHQGGSLPHSLPTSAPESSIPSAVGNSTDDRAKSPLTLTSTAGELAKTTPEALSPVVIPATGVAPPPIGTPPPVPRKRSGSGRLSPHAGE